MGLRSVFNGSVYGGSTPPGSTTYVPHRTNNMQGKTFPGSAAGIVILNNKNEIFLMQRSEKSRNDHNMWSIPGGKVELNESVEDAVIRETKEEADVDVQELEHLGYADHILPEYNQHWIAQIFLATKWTGEPKNMEPNNFDDVGWFSLDNIPESSDVVTRAIELLKSST